MKTVTGCDFSMAEDKNSERALRRVDMECEICLYEAGKLAVEEILMYVIENELDEKEKTAVKLKWFNGMKTSLIAKDNMQAFKELLEDRGFFGASAGKQGDAGNEGTVLGTATYKRVDIGGDSVNNLRKYRN